MNNNELCVPADALAISGGDGSETVDQEGDAPLGSSSSAGAGASVTPEVGDEVEVTIKGKVTRSEGGNVYLIPTEANGMPIKGDAGASPDTSGDDTEESMDAAMNDEAKKGGGSGYLAILLLGLLSMLLCPRAQAVDELRSANMLDCSTIGTNNWVAFSNQASIVFSVEIDNFSGADIYLLVFDAGTNCVAGNRPAASVVRVANGTTGGKNWNPSGARFNSLCVAASTTPFALTNAAAGTGIMTVQRRREL